MNILHVADTHLGYSSYRKVSEEGVNQREKDIYDTFRQFVDYAIDKKPDLIIHAGDLFDSVRPNNRAITFVVEQLLRLSNTNIPFVVIAGNHEHPRLRETGHIFSVFNHIEHVYPVYHEKYERFSFENSGEKLTVHTLPQCNSKQNFQEQIKKIKPDASSDVDIIVVHGAVKGIKAFSMNELNELMIPVNYLTENFDYVALGHYHTYTRLNEKTFYAGSTEHLSFSEANDSKGFIEIELSKSKLKTSFKKLKTREMIDVPPINCADLELSQVMKKILKAIEQVSPTGKIFRIKLTEIPIHIYRGLDFGEIKNKAGEAVHYEIKPDIIRDKQKKQFHSSKIDALTREFQQFVNQGDIKEKKDLLKLGIEYIEKIEAKDEGK